MKEGKFKSCRRFVKVTVGEMAYYKPEDKEVSGYRADFLISTYHIMTSSAIVFVLFRMPLTFFHLVKMLLK